ncbi:hypothetical protein LCGC14_2417690 [marine sediment metagenome]|uniref:DNA (cytosine-5-)-methyltransferase n=1 Tax=marine sediment metagenome TaxID=412755 RepID=A0A0F9CCV3_9ZZZZ
MGDRPRILDLFCGAGGAAMGLHRAGFEVVGVDIEPQKNYPFEFHQADAMTYPLEGFDAYWASPPCQGFSPASLVHRNRGKVYPNLLPGTRERLTATGFPFVIENVPGAPLHAALRLCGTQFGLGVFRHRLFECSVLIPSVVHSKHDGRIGDGKYFSIAGGAGRWKSWGTVHRNISKGTAAEWRQAMGIEWMTRKELTQAIPPAYSEHIGRHLLRALASQATKGSAPSRPGR